MTRRFLFLLPLAALALPGCSYTCHFEGRVTVRDAATGQPVPGVQVKLLNADGNPIGLQAAGADRETSVNETDRQGQLPFKFQRGPVQEERDWKLVLAAPGYEPETVEVGTVKFPKGGNETAYLLFHVAMRKAAP